MNFEGLGCIDRMGLFIIKMLQNWPLKAAKVSHQNLLTRPGRLEKAYRNLLPKLYSVIDYLSTNIHVESQYIIETLYLVNLARAAFCY